uniref:S16 family serine protease n=1 Tax=Streptomyces alkaliphilus TaxID=1472722 RepID=UPI00389AE905
PAAPSRFSAGSRSRRAVVLALCATPVVALLLVVTLLPLPFVVAYPGATVDVLGDVEGESVIEISGTEIRDPDGELRMTTILATPPDADIRLSEVVSGYFSDDRAVMPRDAVYPPGRNTEEIRDYTTGQMLDSQRAAVTAALTLVEGRTGAGPDLPEDLGELDIELRLEDVGGPSAGLLFALGVVELLDGDGEGGDLTGGRVIAGTGAIAPDGRVGSVGGVPLKTRAADRDGAEVFLVPSAECAEANRSAPDGLRVIPVSTLTDAVRALEALESGDPVPTC